MSEKWFERALQRYRSATFVHKEGSSFFCDRTDYPWGRVYSTFEIQDGNKLLDYSIFMRFRPHGAIAIYQAEFQPEGQGALVIPMASYGAVCCEEEVPNEAMVPLANFGVDNDRRVFLPRVLVPLIKSSQFSGILVVDSGLVTINNGEITAQRYNDDSIFSFPEAQLVSLGQTPIQIERVNGLIRIILVDGFVRGRGFIIQTIVFPEISENYPCDLVSQWMIDIFKSGTSIGNLLHAIGFNTTRRYSTITEGKRIYRFLNQK